ncbi:Prepilin-type N-terminal cleavage/methylation domain-containing protein [Desulfonema limicola]|uniref:Prepilin-type N-terminal cleavage/methylation domain-containing protein n=1 Tax=Desulfonema limicola TaxID=45656 RepID=A0A975B8A1_9BACT|nr:type II secretion system protein [Desulfonema limicola]QTA80619.1 Prepilin-type N-terminal cleavage/methylation domain-containing protein [Desulfonema limicola]
MKKKNKNNKGFTLIETMTAMIILAVSLTVILELFSGGLKSARLSDEYTRAIFHAKEKMEEILLADKLTDLESEGEFEDGFKWAVNITLPLAEEIEENEQIKKSDKHLFNIHVSVSWNDGSGTRQFEISTIHIAEKNQEIS